MPATLPTGGPAPRARTRLIALMLFVVFWLFVRWLVWATRADGEPLPTIVVEWLLTPFLAGILVGWWRGPHIGAGILLPGGLSGSAITLLDLCFLLEIWQLITRPPAGLLTLDWDLPVLLVIVAFVLGSFGAMLSSIIAILVASGGLPKRA